jgi:O-antigen/teichoic acid export membrane protein
MASLTGTTGCNLVAVLAGILGGVTLARCLGPAGRGELAAALLWPALLALFADMGLGFSFSYSAAKLSSRFDDLWTLALTCGILIGIVAIMVGFLIMPWVSVSWSAPARAALKIALISVPFTLVSGFLTYLMLGAKLIAEFNIVRVFVSAVYLAVVLALSGLSRPDIRLYAGGYVTVQVLSCLLCYFLICRRRHPRFHLTTDLLPELFSYGLKTQLASVAAQTNLRLDQAVLSLVFSAQQLGYYVVAVAIAGILGPFFNALAIIVLPQATHSPDPAAGAALTARHIKVAVLLSLPVLLLCIVLLPSVLPALMGVGYRPAVLPAQILLGASLFQGLNGVLGNSLRGLGQPSRPAYAEGIGMVITCILLYALLPVMGLAGAAVTSLFAYMAVAAVQFLFLAKAAGTSSAALLAAPLEFSFLRRRVTEGG